MLNIHEKLALRNGPKEMCLFCSEPVIGMRAEIWGSRQGKGRGKPSSDSIGWLCSLTFPFLHSQPPLVIYIAVSVCPWGDPALQCPGQSCISIRRCPGSQDWCPGYRQRISLLCHVSLFLIKVNYLHLCGEEDLVSVWRTHGWARAGQAERVGCVSVLHRYELKYR